MDVGQNKSVFARASVRIGISILLLAAVLLLVTGVVDRYGEEYVERGFKRAAITFAVSRGINGVISVAQGTEVAIQPAGIGINFTPGQILDPINDLIERFSWVMLASSTSLGVQRIVLQIFTTDTVTVLLSLLALLALLTVWLRRFDSGPWRSVVLRTTALLFLIRLLIPGSAIVSEAIYRAFLEEQFHASTQSISAASARIEALNRERDQRLHPQVDDSLLERAKSWYDSTLGQFDLAASIESYRTAAAEVSEEVMELIVIFVFQTIVLPLFFLWVIIRLVRRVVTLQWLLPGRT